jgi:hypothetical protein
MSYQHIARPLASRAQAGFKHANQPMSAQGSRLQTVRLTEEFQTKEGLRQGYSLYPTLFKIYLDRTLKGWQRKCINVALHVGDDILCALYFEGGQMVIAEDRDDLSYVFRKVQEACGQRDMKINKKKSEYMIFGNNEKRICRYKTII